MPDDPVILLQPLFLVEYRIPSITAYNRLEASPRSRDFKRSISAEVRDPLWMLTRQWQFGEFKGEDCGSPINATIMSKTSAMDRIKLGNDPVAPLSNAIPLETQVEKEQQPSNLLTGNQAGRYFIQLLKKAGIESQINIFITEYPLAISNDAMSEEKQFHKLIKDKIPDGQQIVEAVKNGDFANFISGNADETALIEAGNLLQEWWARIYEQSNVNTSAWKTAQLEYQFSIADGEGEERKELVASQYYQGHLDWYSFNLKHNSSLASNELENQEKENEVKSFIPAQVSFKGMPNPRYWQFEEQSIDFGNINTSPTGLLHLLFAEYGLIYSNDWFMLPFPMKVNSLAEIPGIRIKDVFGQYTYIRPANKDWNSGWQNWAMFQLSNESATDNENNIFYLSPSLYKSLESDPLEKVSFVRDEMSNLVWAIEEKVPSAFFEGKSGKETAIEEATPAPTPIASEGEKVKYSLGTMVPSNYTPFIPVHMPGNESEIRLQRARMVNGRVPLGVLLTEKESPYFINEEEIVSSGISVTRSFQRTRWLQGKKFLWIGRQKRNGQDQIWNNLQFDQIEE